jgi:preprotein translocase subunit SecE
MDKKWVHLLFAVAGVVVAWVLAKSAEWVWSYFGRPNGFAVGTGAALVAGVATLIAWRNEQLFTLASEVTTELGKVTWPTRQETMNSTVVVVITTIIAAIFLGLVDAFWSSVIRLIFR